MSKRRKKKSPLWQKLIIAAALIVVSVATLLGVASMFREEALKQNVSTQQDYISILFVDSDSSFLSSQVMGENEFLVASLIPEKEGYTFSHWTSAGKNYSPTELYSLTPNSDMTFTACYTPNTYTVTFDLTGYNTEQSSTKEVSFNQPLGETPAISERAGYVTSWRDNYGNIYTEETLITIASDITLTPYYDPFKYKLIYYSPVSDYDLEEGLFNYIDTQDYRYGDVIEFEEYSILSHLSEGRSYVWKIDGVEVREGSNNFVDLSKYYNGATIELYANWIAETYTATFVLNNGEEDIIQEVEFNSIVTIPTVTKEGYVIWYWYYEVDLDTGGTAVYDIRESTFKYTFSKDMTFYAEWELA